MDLVQGREQPRILQKQYRAPVHPRYQLTRLLRSSKLAYPRDQILEGERLEDLREEPITPLKRRQTRRTERLLLNAPPSCRGV